MNEIRTVINRDYCNIHTNNRIINGRCGLCMRNRINEYSNGVRRRNTGVGGNEIDRQHVDREPINRPHVNRPSINRPSITPRRERQLRQIVNMDTYQDLAIEGNSIENLQYEDLINLEDVEIGISLKNLNSNSKVVIGRDNNRCTICLEVMNGKILRRFNCNHEFHINCCEQWFESKNSCPNCRKKFN